MTTEHTVFLGLFSSLDPYDLQDGQAVIQVNVWSGRAGELQVRSGIRELEGEED